MSSQARYRWFVVLALLLLLAPQASAELTVSEKHSDLTIHPGETGYLSLEFEYDVGPSGGPLNLTITGQISESSFDAGINNWVFDVSNDTASYDLSLGTSSSNSTGVNFIIHTSTDSDQGILNLSLSASVSNGTTDVLFSIEIAEEESPETEVTVTKFMLALFPLIVIFLGIALFKRDGMVMSLVGWLVASALAALYFHTPGEVIMGATGYGIVKAFGISIAVIFTMWMIFVMKEVGALEVISAGIKRAVRSKEEQALFIGIGFGSFLTSLGVTTPAMFPPLLVAMGFTPFAAVAIAVLGYNATTSFALLSIPITLPAGIAGISADDFAWKISLYLPVLSVCISIAMLWMIGGKKSVKRGIVPAVLAGLAIAISCLAFLAFDIVPLRVVGVFAGLVTMIAIFLYHKYLEDRVNRLLKRQPEHPEGIEKALDRKKEPLDVKRLLWALSPWIILMILASIISSPAIDEYLSDLPGEAENITIFADQTIDLNVLSEIYTWILVSLFASLIFLRPTKKQFRSATKVWLQRMWKPFVAFSMYFAIAFIMFFSAMEVVNGALVRSEHYVDYNMNLIMGSALAVAFGAQFMYVAGSLGVFGAFVGGSETASNVMFYGVQRQAAAQTGTDFMTVYGAHAAAGGIASAITPAKITNAVVLIGEGRELEAQIMRKNFIFVVLMTIAIGLMTALFITLNL